MSIRSITPRHRRRLAQLQHGLWVAAARFGIRNPLPLQLYKHLERIKLPRRFRAALRETD